MRCSDCGSEIGKGSYYCTGCGKPVGFLAQKATMTEEADIAEVPAPGPAMDRPPSAPSVPPATEEVRPRKALCSLCMGSFPETVLSRIDGHAYCPDCSPLTARHTAPLRPAGPAAEEDEGPPPNVYDRPRTPVFLTEEKSGGGRAKFVLVAVALLAVAGAAFAAWSILGKSRIDRMLSGLDTSARPARLLCEKYTAGERIGYHLEVRAKGDMEASGAVLGSGSGDGSLDAKLYGDFAIDVLDVDAEGNSELQLTVANLDLTGRAAFGGMEHSLDGMGANPLKQLSGQTLVMKVDPFGKPIGTVSGSFANLPGMQGFLGSQFADAPRHELSVGDEWTATQSFDLGGAGGFVPSMPGGMSVTCRVEGYKRVKGRDCMAISIRGSMDDGGGLQMPGMSMEFGLDLEGVMFYDPEGGRLVQCAMDVSGEFEGEGQGNGVQVEFQLELDLELQ